MLGMDICFFLSAKHGTGIALEGQNEQKFIFYMFKGLKKRKGCQISLELKFMIDFSLLIINSQKSY